MVVGHLQPKLPTAAVSASYKFGCSLHPGWRIRVDRSRFQPGLVGFRLRQAMVLVGPGRPRHRGGCKGGERNQHSILCKPKSRQTEAWIQAGDMEPAQACHRMDSQSTTGHVETTWPEGSSIGPTGGCRPAQDMVGHSTVTCVHKITIIFSPVAEGRPANEDERSPLRPNKRRQSDCGLSRPDPETVPSRRA